jgi:hypothetical protein
MKDRDKMSRSNYCLKKKMRLCTIATQIIFTISQMQSKHEYNIDKVCGIVSDAEKTIFHGETVVQVIGLLQI